MHRLKKLTVAFVISATLTLGVNVVGDAFASGSYAPPKVRNAGQNAKIELYHLGKRLVLKMLNPSEVKLTGELQSEQQAQLAAKHADPAKHLKSVALGHLSALNAKELRRRYLSNHALRSNNTMRNRSLKLIASILIMASPGLANATAWPGFRPKRVLNIVREYVT